MAGRLWWQIIGGDRSLATTPIQTTATFLTSGPTVTSLAALTNAIIKPLGAGNFNAPTWVASTSTTNVLCTFIDSTNTIANFQMNVPVGAYSENQGQFDNSVGFLDESTPYLYVTLNNALIGSSQGSATSGGVVSATNNVIVGGEGMLKQDATGPVLMDALNGSVTSSVYQNGDNVTGNITYYDLQQVEAGGAIQHTIAITIGRNAFSNEVIWPLVIGDTQGTGGIPEGAILAIPSGTAMPSGLTTLGKALFTCFMNFGALVNNVTENGEISVQACNLDSPTTTLISNAQINGDFATLVPLLRCMNFTNVAGAQLGLSTLKGRLASATSWSDIAPPPALLDFTATGGVPVLPTTFGAWQGANGLGTLQPVSSQIWENSVTPPAVAINLSDTLTPTDSFTLVKSGNAALGVSDTLSIADSFTIVSLIPPLNLSSSTQEIVFGTFPQPSSFMLDDILGPIDSFQVGLVAPNTFPLSLSDTLTLSDSFTVTQPTLQAMGTQEIVFGTFPQPSSFTFADNLAPSDPYTVTLLNPGTFTIPLADSLSPSDGYTLTVKPFTVSLSDTLSPSDPFQIRGGTILPLDFSNVSATQGPFSLPAGTFGITVSSASFNGGSVTLEVQSLDGVTFIPVLPPFKATGYGIIQLPAGVYELVISGGATAVYAQIALDAGAVSPLFPLSVADTLSPSDALIVAANATISVSDTLSPTDAVTPSVNTVAVNLADTLAPSDALTVAQFSSLAQSDTLSPTDVVAVSLVSVDVVTVSDTLSPSDTVTSSFNPVAVSIVDTLTPSDAFTVASAFVDAISVSDTLAATDNFPLSAQFAPVALSDSLSPSDAFTIPQPVIGITDTLSPSDVFQLGGISSPLSFSNVSTTQGPFALPAGTYGVSVSSASFSGGSVTLEILSGDGVTYVPVLPPFTATGYGVVPLPAGTYELVIAGGATAVYAQLALDTPALSPIFPLSQADTLAISDSFIFKNGGAIAFTLADTLNPLDAYTLPGTLTFALSDTLSPSDAYTLAAVAPLSLSDIPGISDAFSFNTPPALSLADTLTDVDAYTLSFTFTMALSDTLAPTDAFTLNAPPQIAQADSLSPSDAFTVASLAALTLSDTPSVSDAYPLSLVVPITLADTLAAVDALQFNATPPTEISDTLAASDAYAFAASLTISIQDTVTPADLFALVAASQIVLTDNLVPSDAFSLSTPVSVALADSLAPSDSFSLSIALPAMSISDTLAPIDALTVNAVGSFEIDDALDPSDAYFVSANASLVISDIDNANDLYEFDSNINTFNMSFSDSLNTNEGLAFIYSIQSKERTLFASRNNRIVGPRRHAP